MNLRRAVAVGAAVLLAAAAAWHLRPRPHRPDIVLVVWDTCRADRLSAYGHGRPTTPWLESLAGRGVRFHECIAPAPWTGPSHASLFTGLLPSRHGLEVGLGDRVPASIPVLAETLRDAGYETAGFSANAYVSPVTGLSRGFEHFENTFGPRGQERAAEFVVARVRAWLDGGRRGGRPLFLFVNMMDMHLGLEPTEEDVAAVRDPDVTDAALARARRVDGRAALAHMMGIERIDTETLDGLRVLYDGAARHADRYTGELLDLLESRGAVGADRLVIVTSDHGENLGEHGEMDHRMSLYDPVLRVPLVLHRPGSLEGGVVVKRQVRLQDAYPTILAIAGIAVPRGTGSHALPLLPLPEEGRTAISEFALPRAYEPEFRRGFPNAPPGALSRLDVSILSARESPDRPAPRKYIRFTRHDARGVGALEREELYDPAADPAERLNLLLAGRDPDARAAAARLEALLREAGSLR